ncbi:hypothetical protein DXG01_004389 [Tephrocybe rancida]|nr:hypothetical protein DXG01_004389 [Tephrocybe rancida]
MSVIVTQAPSATAEEMRIAAVATALPQTADPDTSQCDQETRTWQMPGGLVTPIPKQQVQSEAQRASVGAVTPSQGDVGVTELESPQVRQGQEQQTAVPMATPTTNGRNHAQSTPGTLQIPHTPVFSPIPEGVKLTPCIELTPKSAIEDRCRIRFRPAQHFFQNASSLGLLTTPEIHMELVVEDDMSDTNSGQNAEEAMFNCCLTVYWMEHPEVPKVSTQCRLQEQTHRSLGEQQALGVAIPENLSAQINLFIKFLSIELEECAEWQCKQGSQVASSAPPSPYQQIVQLPSMSGTTRVDDLMAMPINQVLNLLEAPRQVMETLADYQARQAAAARQRILPRAVLRPMGVLATSETAPTEGRSTSAGDVFPQMPMPTKVDKEAEWINCMMLQKVRDGDLGDHVRYMDP